MRYPGWNVRTPMPTAPRRFVHPHGARAALECPQHREEGEEAADASEDGDTTTDLLLKYPDATFASYV